MSLIHIQTITSDGEPLDLRWPGKAKTWEEALGILILSRQTLEPVDVHLYTMYPKDWAHALEEQVAHVYSQYPKASFYLYMGTELWFTLRREYPHLMVVHTANTQEGFFGTYQGISCGSHHNFRVGRDKALLLCVWDTGKVLVQFSCA